MSKTCICVQDNNGLLEIAPGTPRELWHVVRGEAARVERLRDLYGWGRYTGLYRVTMHDAYGPVSYLYMVEE